jgi:hypothetical protein
MSVKYHTLHSVTSALRRDKGEGGNVGWVDRLAAAKRREEASVYTVKLIK